jgi:hypothetical protein
MSMSSKIVIDDFNCIIGVFDEWVNSINFKGHLNQELNFCNCYEEEELLDEDEPILREALFLKFAELYYHRFQLHIVMVVAGIEYMRDNQYGKMCMNHEANSILAVQGILYEMYEGEWKMYNDDMDNLIEYVRKNLAERYAE